MRPAAALFRRLGRERPQSVSESPVQPSQDQPGATVDERKEDFAAQVERFAAEGRRFALDLVGDRSTCGPDCDHHLDTWGDWIRTSFRGTLPVDGPLRRVADGLLLDLDPGDETEYVVPGVALALLVVPDSHDAYLERIGAKSRNMLRKFEREGYITGDLDYNAHLDEIYEINTSKPVRSGGPMTEAYRQRPTPISTAPDPCPRHRTVYAAAFREGRALAYAQLVLVNELAVVSQILGHADALRHGVMNGLVRELVDISRASGCVRAINYLTLRSSTEGLDRFKRSVGFAAYSTFARVPVQGD